MNSRTMELTLKYADGDITPEEFAELQAALDRDEEIVRLCLRQLDIEAALRDFPEGLDLAGPTLERIRREIGSRIVSGTLRTIAEDGARQPVRRWRFGPVLALAASVLVAVGLWRIVAGARRQAMSEGMPVTVEAVQGGGFRIQNNRKQPLKIGNEIRDGDRIGTSENESVRLAMAGEATTLELEPGTTLEFGTWKAGRPIRLDAGKLTATVAKQAAAYPLVIETPVARATVRGTTLTVWARPEAALLQVKEGEVEFERLADKVRLTVQSGQEAAVAAGRPFAVGPISVLDGLVAHWTMDEIRSDSIPDSSGRGNHARLQNGPIQTAGRIGNALELDGRDDFLESAVRQPAPKIFTLALWFKTTTGEGNKLIGFGDLGPGKELRARDRQIHLTNPGQIFFTCLSGTTSLRLITTKSYNDGAWHHVAAVLSPAEMALYVDGALVAAGPAPASPASYDGRWIMGYGKTRHSLTHPDLTDSTHFKGILDDVRVYDRALTLEEVQILAGAMQRGQ